MASGFETIVSLPFAVSGVTVVVSLVVASVVVPELLQPKAVKNTQNTAR